MQQRQPAREDADHSISPTSANPGGSVHVWTARPGDLCDAAAIATCRSWLSDEERAREARFLRAEHRHLFLVAHALLRRALSEFGDATPEEWRFTTGEHGRPLLLDHTGLGFSLSHTSGLVACAISDEIDCGVDVEGLGRTKDPRALAKRFFSKSENAELDALTGDKVDARFLEFWTLKEAYVKARGVGLQVPLERFHFPSAPDGGITAVFDAPIVDDPAGWQFEQWRPDAGHVLALAVRRRGDGSKRRVVCRDAGALPGQLGVLIPDEEVRGARNEWDLG